MGGAPRWHEQYDRMKRWRARVEQGTGVEDQRVDDFYAFFTSCFPTSRAHELRPTRALEPDHAAIEPAVQVAAAAVLGNEGDEGGEDIGHETGS